MCHTSLVPEQITISKEQAAKPIVIDLDKRQDFDLTIEDGVHAFVLCTTTGKNSQKIEQRCTVGNRARLHLFIISRGSNVEHHLVSTCLGPEAVSTVDWLFLAQGNDRQTLSARNVFQSNEGGGEITMRGVAQDKAHISADGMIEIGPQGKGTHTYLTQNVLMLDPTTRVDAVPGLEIKTNDVKASHSATVSRVTPEDLFYFGARGILEVDARAMFIEGFLGEMLERIPDAELRASVRQAITVAP